MQLGGNRFFLAFSPEVNQEAELPEEEAWHLIKVLRKKQGDKIHLVDGRGKEYLGEIRGIKKSGRKIEVKVLICKVLREEVPSPFKVKVLMPLLKGDKKDFLIEKLTELGADVILPYFSRFTEAKPKENLMERFQKKAISAIKQCGRLWLPEIENPQELTKLLEKLKKEKGLFLWASEKGNQEIPFQAQNIVLISGPEGGFSPEEEALLKEKFIPIRLSPYILRAETACISLMSLISHHVLSKNLAK